MNNAIHLLSFIFPVIAFIFEAYPRFINRKFGVDVWTHLLYLKEYHRQKGIPKKIENGFLVPGVYDYPPAFIYILSKFPFNLVEKYEFLFSPFFDAVHLLVIYFFAFQITGNMWIAIFTQLLYTLTPIVVIENSSATPRSLGYTLFSLVFMSMFSYIHFGVIWYLLLAILLGAIIFLSHRFTTQGFLFFSIFFSFYFQNTIYIIVFLSSFILAIIISRGFYLRVLRGHLGNLVFWKNNIKYRFFHQIKGDSKKHINKDFVFRVYNQFLKFPPFVLTITNPWTLPLFYFAIYSYPVNNLFQYLFLWAIFAYVLALITIWVPWLRFLGEGQRYLELAAFPTSFTAAKLLINLTETSLYPSALLLYLIIAIGAVITILVIQRKAIIKDKLRTLTPELQQMFSYLKSLENKPRLLCIPHQITTNTIYNSNTPVFVNADYSSIGKISEVYPFIKKPINQIMEKYKLDLILINEEYAAIKDLKLKQYKIIKKFNNIALISIVNSGNNEA